MRIVHRSWGHPEPLQCSGQNASVSSVSTDSQSHLSRGRKYIMIPDSRVSHPQKTAHPEGSRLVICRLCRTLAALLSVLVLLFAGLLTLPKLVGIEPYVVMSGSMEPAIRTGALAFVDTGAGDVREGDIIAFRVSSGEGEAQTITHRVIRRTGEGWITKGDANRTEDAALVSSDQLVGRYLFSIPKLGALLAGREKETGLLLVLWVLAANLLSGLVEALLGEGDPRGKAAF